jgi:hypothetical protein
MKSKTRKRIIIIWSSVITFIGFVIWFGNSLAPGSYPYAEIYEMQAPEKEVIESISKFKSHHQEMIVPDITIDGYPAGSIKNSEGKRDGSYWYINYYYYPNENEIVFTWTRPTGNGNTDLALVSINQGLDIGHWKDINKDFKRAENKKIKTQFENKILKQLGIKFTDKGNSMLW